MLINSFRIYLFIFIFYFISDKKNIYIFEVGLQNIVENYKSQSSAKEKSVQMWVLCISIKSKVLN